MGPTRRLVSGMQPTGLLHLGNLEGALRNWVRLQDEFETFVFVADWHALTSMYANPAEIAKYATEMVIDFIAAGMDVSKSILFRQSDVKEHADLHLLLSMITPIAWLERVPTYKEKRERLQAESTTYGLLGYPVLQAADILIYKASAVPVGRDQLPHLELTREIARRFNHLYGHVFPEPDAILTESPTVVGLDGRKMSKSYGNTILISDKPEVIKAKVRTMFTDPTKIRKTDPGHPDTCPVFQLHKICNPDTAPEANCACREGRLGCVEHKNALAEYVVRLLEPIQAKRRKLEDHPKQIEAILKDGAARATEIATETISQVRQSMQFQQGSSRV